MGSGCLRLCSAESGRTPLKQIHTGDTANAVMLAVTIDRLLQVCAAMCPISARNQNEVESRRAQSAGK